MSRKAADLGARGKPRRPGPGLFSFFGRKPARKGARNVASPRGRHGSPHRPNFAQRRPCGPGLRAGPARKRWMGIESKLFRISGPKAARKGAHNFANPSGRWRFAASPKFGPGRFCAPDSIRRDPPYAQRGPNAQAQAAARRAQGSAARLFRISGRKTARKGAHNFASPSGRWRFAASPKFGPRRFCASNSIRRDPPRAPAAQTRRRKRRRGRLRGKAARLFRFFGRKAAQKGARNFASLSGLWRRAASPKFCPSFAWGSGCWLELHSASPRRNAAQGGPIQAPPRKPAAADLKRKTPMTNVDNAKRPGGALRVVCLACASAAPAWPWLARADEPPQSGRAPIAQAAAPNKTREPYLEAEPLREAPAAELRKVDNLAADLAKASAQPDGLAKSDE